MKMLGTTEGAIEPGATVQAAAEKEERRWIEIETGTGTEIESCSKETPKEALRTKAVAEEVAVVPARATTATTATTITAAVATATEARAIGATPASPNGMSITVSESSR